MKNRILGILSIFLLILVFPLYIIVPMVYLASSGAWKGLKEWTTDVYAFCKWVKRGGE